MTPASASSSSKSARIDLAIRFVEGIQGFVDAYPARLVQQQAREGEALRFLAGQFTVPVRAAIELRRQSAERDAIAGGDQIRDRANAVAGEG